MSLFWAENKPMNEEEEEEIKSLKAQNKQMNEISKKQQ